MIKLVCASLQTYRLTIAIMMILVVGRIWINQTKIKINTETETEQRERKINK